MNVTANVDCKTIVFGKLKKGIDTHMMSMYVRLTDNGDHIEPEKLMIQVNDVSFDNVGSRGNYMDVTTKNPALYELVKNVESHTLTQLKENKDQWFGKPDIDDVFLESGLSSTAVKDSKFRLRVMDDVKIYDGEKTEKSFSDLKANTRCHLIIQLVGVWFTPGRWGVTWKVMQVKLKDKRTGVYDYKKYLFSDNDSDDDRDEDLNALKVPPTW